jgi:hypothetical protein
MSVNDTNRNGSMHSVVEESAEPVSSQEPIQVHESTVVNGRREPATTFATRADAKGTEGIDRQKLVLLGGGLAVAVLFFVFMECPVFSVPVRNDKTGIERILRWHEARSIRQSRL